MRSLLLSLLILLSFLSTPLFCADNNTSEAQKQSKSSDQTLLVSYEETPVKLYLNEIFVIKIKALLASDQLGKLTTTINGEAGIKLLNPSYKWKLENDGTFSLALYFKTVAAAARLPQIQTVAEIQGKQSESVTLDGKTVEVLEVPQAADFCGVIASKLKVVNYKMDHYDNGNNILVLDIEARQANLEDFKLSAIKNQGVNTLKNSMPDGKMFYYVTIPSNQQTLEFSYLNSEKTQMEKVTIALDPEKLEDKVSTQTDINPKGKDRLFYVVGTGLFFSTILAAFFWRTRRRLYLALIGAVVVGCSAYLLFPHDKITLKKGCIVYVLPTENSTAFYQCEGDLAVEKLKNADGYVKIKMLDGKVGWSKEECVLP